MATLLQLTARLPIQKACCSTSPSSPRAQTTSIAPGGSSLTLWVDETYPYLMVFTGDPLEPARRRRGLAIEPMTCPPNAFQSGEALLVLQPGERFMGSWGITPDLTP